MSSRKKDDSELPSVAVDSLDLGTDALDDSQDSLAVDEDTLDEKKAVMTDATPEEQLNELQKGFQERARQEQLRFQDVTDSEYWCCLCFESREQCNAFLRAVNWLQFGDKYLDGTLIAEALKIPLPEANIPYVKEKPDRVLNDLSLPL